jgi:hypothetical protein
MVLCVSRRQDANGKNEERKTSLLMYKLLGYARVRTSLGLELLRALRLAGELREEGCGSFAGCSGEVTTAICLPLKLFGVEHFPPQILCCFFYVRESVFRS